VSAELLHITPLWVAVKGTRTCWGSQSKSDTVNGICGPKDRELLARVGNKFKHGSILESITMNFYLKTDRATLQELARHRHQSLSVRSSRYTLGELKKESPFIHYDGSKRSDAFITDDDYNRASKYITFTDNSDVDGASMYALENLRKLISSGVSNDIAKFAMPESYKTELTSTWNARSLQNFLKLRSAKSALWSIRKLANEMYAAIPEEYVYLFKDCMENTDEQP
jgi:thymidylate synthase (FAD)